MFAWLRIAIVILKGLFRGGNNPFDESVLNFRVWPHESEVSYANQAIFPHYLELGRWNWAIRCRVLGIMLSRRLLFMMGGQILHYRKPLKRFGLYQIRSKIVGWDGRWIYYEQIIHSGAEKSHYALVKLCCNARGHKVSPVEFFKILGAPVTEPERLTPAILHWRETETGMIQSDS